MRKNRMFYKCMLFLSILHIFLCSYMLYNSQYSKDFFEETASYISSTFQFDVYFLSSYILISIRRFLDTASIPSVFTIYNPKTQLILSSYIKKDVILKKLSLHNDQHSIFLSTSLLRQRCLSTIDEQLTKLPSYKEDLGSTEISTASRCHLDNLSSLKASIQDILSTIQQDHPLEPPSEYTQKVNEALQRVSISCTQAEQDVTVYDSSPSLLPSTPFLYCLYSLSFFSPSVSRVKSLSSRMTTLHSLSPSTLSNSSSSTAPTASSNSTNLSSLSTAKEETFWSSLGSLFSPFLSLIPLSTNHIHTSH